jgi:hypothetical protein
MLTSAFTAVLFYLRGIYGILAFVLQDSLPYGSVDFTASAVLQDICAGKFIPIILSFFKSREHDSVAHLLEGVLQ